ncbi:TPA: hypothetical protein ACWMHO_001674 [Enterococcus faecium]|nr:hypothetical protein [Enterococcus faecium]
MFKKMEKESFYYGFPVVLMTTKDEMTGNDNLTPISSTWTLGKTIVIGISMHSKGYTNLKVGHAATFNLADQTLWEKSRKSQRRQAILSCPIINKKLAIPFALTNFNWESSRN